MTEQPPPGVPRHFDSPTGTWDEWLMMRPSSDESGDFAEYVATMLRHGLSPMIDYGQPQMRDGIRQLFSEFEQATEGQHIVLRKPEPPTVGTVQITAGAVGNRVRVTMGLVDHGEPLATDLPCDKATALIHALIAATEAAAAAG